MSKEKGLIDTPQPLEMGVPPRHVQPASPISKVLVAAFAVVILGGAAFGLSRTSRLESEFTHALNNCGATLLPIRGVVEKNGLEDMYALVEFQTYRDSITKYLGFCETSPDLARTVFRRALDEGNRNARMVALCSAFYLAQSKYLAAEDWDRIVKCLNPERESEIDVRRIAQRAVADLILIKERPSKGALLATPEGYKETDTDATSGRADFRDFNYQGSKYYQARWTSPAFAWAWLQQNGKTSKWDDKLQRFIVE